MLIFDFEGKEQYRSVVERRNREVGNGIRDLNTMVFRDWSSLDHFS